MCTLCTLNIILYSLCQSEVASWFWRTVCLQSSHKPDLVCLLLLQSYCISNMFCWYEEIFVEALQDSFLLGMIHGMCLVSWKVLKAHAVKPQLPVRSLALYFSGLVLFTFIEGLHVIVKKEQSKGYYRRCQLLCNLLIIVTTWLVRCLSQVVLVLRSESEQRYHHLTPWNWFIGGTYIDHL